MLAPSLTLGWRVGREPLKEIPTVATLGTERMRAVAGGDRRQVNAAALGAGNLIGCIDVDSVIMHAAFPFTDRQCLTLASGKPWPRGSRTTLRHMVYCR